MVARGIMTEDVITVPATTPVKELAGMLMENDL